MTNKHYSKAQQALSGFLAFVLLLSLTVSAFAADMSNFTDVSGHWAYHPLPYRHTEVVENGKKLVMLVPAARDKAIVNDDNDCAFIPTAP